MTGRSPLPVTQALPVACAARNALMRAMNRLGVARLPDDFHHAFRGRGHSAYWLPEDADGDGLIDHVLLVHLDGLPEALIPAMALGGEIGFGGGWSWRLAPVWMGTAGPGGLFGPARCWISQTPFVTPLPADRQTGPGKPARPRASRALAEQIVKALGQASRPVPVNIEVFTARKIGGTLIVPANFAFDGLGHRPPPAGAETAFVMLRFGEALWGPMALGFGAQSGLGLFQPMQESEPAKHLTAEATADS
nr:hypothetical protein [uncultured Rhodopila sp.]